ncbi:MAG: hypothetical protein JWN08_129 [Frankiales bacterium]|nr:hypothetical protein [Frankiales bacterium]
MTPRNLKIIAIVLVLAGIGGIIALSRSGNPKDHVLRTYDVVSQEGDSYTLTSPDPVTKTAGDIRDAWKPAQELVDPGGTFLRYKDLVVAVTPRVEGGSTIYLDDEERGYGRWFPYVVGFWGFGGTGGPIGGTRGGGPGAGK